MRTRTLLGRAAWMVAVGLLAAPPADAQFAATHI